MAIRARSVVVLLALLATTARAEVHRCTSNADCKHGFSCEEEPGDGTWCLLALCDTHADCASGMQCVPPLEQRCPPAARCTPDAERGQCMPPYAAPCKRDQDCGPYYHCIERQNCGCWWAKDSPDKPCGCRGDGVFRCEPTAADCDPERDDTCPPGWVCGGFQPTDNVCYQPNERDGGACEIVERPRLRTCEPPVHEYTQSYRRFVLPETCDGGPCVIAPQPPQRSVAQTQTGGAARPNHAAVEAAQLSAQAAKLADDRHTLAVVLAAIAASIVIAALLARRRKPSAAQRGKAGQDT